jgi:plasmid stabilization system protein ParE
VPKQYRLQYLPLFWDDLERAKAPAMAQVYKTTRSRPQPYYRFAVGNYMVFYAVIGNAMEVRRLIYGARDLAKMLP